MSVPNQEFALENGVVALNYRSQALEKQLGDKWAPGSAQLPNSDPATVIRLEN